MKRRIDFWEEDVLDMCALPQQWRRAWGAGTLTRTRVGAYQARTHLKPRAHLPHQPVEERVRIGFGAVGGEQQAQLRDGLRRQTPRLYQWSACSLRCLSFKHTVEGRQQLVHALSVRERRVQLAPHEEDAPHALLHARLAEEREPRVKPREVLLDLLTQFFKLEELRPRRVGSLRERIRELYVERLAARARVGAMFFTKQRILEAGVARLLGERCKPSRRGAGRQRGEEMPPHEPAHGAAAKRAIHC
mmetsp:Transcript_20195/g.46594  ORF Transcript_20195/g.46594 Transcript_20195/m.46594 type:complete len:247 (+) Transcript_20195:861-1601(+)